MNDLLWVTLYSRYYPGVKPHAWDVFWKDVERYPNEPKLVVFDFDDVILNGSATRTAAELMEQGDTAKQILSDMITACYGKKPKQKNRIIDKYHMKGLALLKDLEMERLYQECIKKGPRPGIYGILTRLRDTGYVLAVISTIEETLIKRFLDKFNLLQYFEHNGEYLVRGVKCKLKNDRFTGEYTDKEVFTRGKGAVLRDLLKKLNIKPDCCVAVGDGITDPDMFEEAKGGCVLFYPYAWEEPLKRIKYEVFVSQYVMYGLRNKFWRENLFKTNTYLFHLPQQIFRLFNLLPKDALEKVKTDSSR